MKSVKVKIDDAEWVERSAWRGAYYASMAHVDDDPAVVEKCRDAAYWAVFFALEDFGGQDVKRGFAAGWKQAIDENNRWLAEHAAEGSDAETPSTSPSPATAR